MKPPRLEGYYATKSDIGRVRLTNEDRAIALYSAKGEFLLSVADGMGGANKGDYASKLAVDTLSEAFVKKPQFPNVLLSKLWLNATLKKANRRIYGATEESALFKGMGTTMVVALFTGKKIVIANIGDSRAYVLGKDGFKRVTEDQSYVSYLIRTGKITKEQALTHPDRHLLMNAMGVYPSLSLAYVVLDYEGQTVMLCTDGVYNSLSEEEMEAALKMELRTDQKVDTLIAMALDKGGSDNCGIALWESKHD